MQRLELARRCRDLVATPETPWQQQRNRMASPEPLQFLSDVNLKQYCQEALLITILSLARTRIPRASAQRFSCGFQYQPGAGISST